METGADPGSESWESPGEWSPEPTTFPDDDFRTAKREMGRRVRLHRNSPDPRPLGEYRDPERAIRAARKHGPGAYFLDIPVGWYPARDEKKGIDKTTGIHTVMLMFEVLPREDPDRVNPRGFDRMFEGKDVLFWYDGDE